MKNTPKTLEQVFLSELEQETASENFGCSHGLIVTMRSKIKNRGEYPTVKTMADYLENAGYQITCDWRIVKTN